MIGNSNLTFRPFAIRPRANSLLTGLELGLHVANVFNKRYADPGSIEHQQSSIDQNGRTFMLRLTSRF